MYTAYPILSLFIVSGGSRISEKLEGGGGGGGRVLRNNMVKDGEGGPLPPEEGWKLPQAPTLFYRISIVQKRKLCIFHE